MPGNETTVIVHQNHAMNLPLHIPYYSFGNFPKTSPHISILFNTRYSSEAFGHRKTLRRSVGVVDLLVVLSDSAIESKLPSYTYSRTRGYTVDWAMGCAARGGRSHEREAWARA